MSRTFRKILDGEFIINGKVIHWNDINRKDFPIGFGYRYRRRIIKQRDRKPFGKPPKWFKQMKRRIERAQVMDALRNQKEVIPIFRKTDCWDWT